MDEDGRPIGTRPKRDVHAAETPLHRGVSCYVFDPRGRLLITRRASTKVTFPGLWSNTVCGHPGPGESDEAAVLRRARHELALPVHGVVTAISDFRYRATFNGIEENEVCPVYVARTDSCPDPNPDEVDDWRWVTWTDLIDSVAAMPGSFSYWCRLQVAQLTDRAAGLLPR